MLKYENEFKKMVEIAAWMDKARWETLNAYGQVSIGDENFQNLESSKKILVHWLCYINDYQRNVDELWQKGGIVFTGIVKEIDTTRSGRDYLYLIKDKFRATDNKKSNDGSDNSQKLIPFEIKEKSTKFSPRDWGSMYGVLRTLYILKENYDGNIIKFFVSQISKDKSVEYNIDNIAKRSYILSYKDISKAKSKKDKENKLNEIIRGWWKSENNANAMLEKLIENIENDFKKEIDDNSWKNKKYENKRLWAALRDYLEPSYKLNEIFLKAITETKPEITFFHENINKIMPSVEFPGDIWNIRFAKNTIWNFAKSNEKEEFLREFSHRKNGKDLKESINFSHLVRTCYESLLYQDKKQVQKYYPAQMDVSYDFASRMCSKCKFENMDLFCPFGSGEEINKLCIGINSKKTEEQYCPLLLMTCGYRFICKTEVCSILQQNKKGMKICNRDLDS